MLHPAMAEMAARARTAEIQQTAAGRSLGSEAYIAPEGTVAALSTRRGGRANPQRAVGWFLVSVGLRLAMPRPRAGSTR